MQAALLGSDALLCSAWALPGRPPPVLVPSWATVKMHFGDWEDSEPGIWGIWNFFRELGSVLSQLGLGGPITLIPGAFPASHCG